jgi:hypothetical protein
MTIYKNISIDRYDRRYDIMINDLYYNVKGYFYGTKNGDIFVLITPDPISFISVTLVNARYRYSVTNVSNIVSNSLFEMEEHQIDESIYENLNNSMNDTTRYDSSMYDNGIYSNEYI